jgi:hypothetical protein
MSQARESMSRAWVPIRVMALVVALGGVWVVPNCARAEDELQKVLSEAGRVWYDKYCVSCHGAGGAPGKAVYPDSKQPVDLRVYVQRHGGKFPVGNWLSVVSGPPTSRVHSEVWETIRKQHRTSVPTGEFEARGIVASIAEYVISVQTK